MSRALIALCCMLTGCGAAPGPKAPPDRAVAVAVAPMLPPRPAARAPAPASYCTVQPRLAACVPRPDGASRATLTPRIDAASQKVLDSRFQDADSLVEVARLQLLRDNPREPNGQSDADEARRNAMRAVIVDATPQAKLVLALAMTRLYQENAGSNGSKLKLFYQVLGRTLPVEGAGPAVSAARALAGYHALAIGEADEAQRWFEQASSGEGASPLAARGLADLAQSISRPKPQPALLTLPAPPLGDEPTPPDACDAQLRNRKEAAAFCAAIDQFRAAASATTKRDAGVAMVRAYGDFRPLCQAREPACGSNVVRALRAASHALAQTELAKSVATARLALETAEGDARAPELAPSLARQLADDYFVIGELSQAGRWYQRYVDLASGKQSGAEAEVALIAGIVLGDPAVEGWARRLTRDGRFTAERRAAWSRALEGEAETAAVQEPCPPVLHCAFMELVRDGRWSPGAARAGG